jgi:hypothetical protein
MSNFCKTSGAVVLFVAKNAHVYIKGFGYETALAITVGPVSAIT